MLKLVFGSILSALVLVLTACGGDDEKSSTVEVSLEEWEIAATPAEVSPGRVTFEAANNGTRPHQMLVVKSDLPPTQLPTADVLVDESKVIISGSVEQLEPGGSASLELELFPGKYLLICNLVDRPATGPADPHYLNGMVLPFLVLDK
jgi:uncharacterized cupredoxin-like copper-binding protein